MSNRSFCSDSHTGINTPSRVIREDWLINQTPGPVSHPQKCGPSVWGMAYLDKGKSPKSVSLKYLSGLIDRIHLGT